MIVAEKSATTFGDLPDMLTGKWSNFIFLADE